MLSEAVEVGGDGLRCEVRLAPGASWMLTLQVVPSCNFAIGAPDDAARDDRDGTRPRRRLARALARPAPATRDKLDAARAQLSAGGPRPRRTADALRRERRIDRRGPAVVHDRLRSGHHHCEPPDAAARLGPLTRGAARARRTAGSRGRSLDRRRAREDRARTAARKGCGTLVRPLLRNRRRDSALPRAPLGALALDR